MLGTLSETATFLLEHADLIEDLAKALESGGAPADLKAAIRAVKVTVSDAAMKEELGG